MDSHSLDTPSTTVQYLSSVPPRISFTMAGEHKSALASVLEGNSVAIYGPAGTMA
jgi:hypothetical protein